MNRIANTTIEDAYSAYFPLIREKCTRMVSNPADAQDIAQETFIRLWKHRQSIENDHSIPAWLYRTSTRLAVDLLRQQKRRTTSDLDEERLVDDREFSVNQQIDAARMLATVASKIPKRELEAAILARCDELTHVAIARVLGVSERTVRRLLQAFDRRISRLVSSPTLQRGIR